MPTFPPPYAKVLVSRNSGPFQSGGIVAQGGDTIALAAESTVSWKANRWEIYSYPPGWSAPAGWVTDATGVIFSVALTPPTFTLPSLPSFGKWLFALRINEALTDDKLDAPPLSDRTTGLSVLSSNNLRDTGALEEQQFDAIASFIGDIQRNWRIIDAVLSGFTPIGTLTPGPANTVFVNNGTGTAVVNTKIVDANVDPTAAIAGTKISPSFGSQDLTARAGTFSGDVVIGGNLTINGTTTHVNSTVVDFADRVIHVNRTTGVAPVPSQIAGIEIDRGSADGITPRAGVGLFWDEINSTFRLAFNTGADDTTVGADAPLHLSGLVVSGLASGVVHSVGGTITSGSVSLTDDVSGILPPANGGTGLNAAVTGLLVGNGSAYSSVTGADTRIPFWSSDTLTTDAGLTFGSSTLSATNVTVATNLTLTALAGTDGPLQVVGGVVGVGPAGANSAVPIIVASRTALALVETGSMRTGWQATTQSPLERWVLVTSDTVVDSNTRVAAKNGGGTNGNWILEIN